MSLSFYTSIIEEEKKTFNVKDESLRIAAQNVSSTYSRGNLTKGSTFLDYNNPSNRCAYLYKYASIHTTLVTKFFKPMIDQSSVRAILEYKNEIKICCLGGGPGTDIIGIFQALSSFASFNRKITHVTVLDLCGGWRNSFKHIISRLKHGKVDNVPSSFIDSQNFTASLIEVNLLEHLPAKVVKAIASADIISMVKFVSAVVGKPESLKALKIIGDYIKIGALVLFIDNFHGNVLGTLNDVSQQCGFSTIIKPLHEQCKGNCRCSSSKKVFDSAPLNITKVSVAGWLKTQSTLKDSHIEAIKSNDLSSLTEDDSWDTASEDEDRLIPIENSSAVLRCNYVDNIEEENISFCDKFTQTKANHIKIGKATHGMLSIEEMVELSGLVLALKDLMVVLKKFQTCKEFQTQLFCNSIQDILKNILQILDNYFSALSD